ncbi:MAG: class III extradiol dioxygenase subunit B-like domain-containing protein [Patescibacteria group bacterium]
MDIVFTCISPHAPIFLPSIGSKEDRQLVKKTIENLEFLGKKLSETKPNSIIISSPHQDWGFNVPLHFLAKDFEGEIKEILIGSESPEFYFKEGKKIYNKLEIENCKLKIALISSGDLSHCLKEDGPYGFHPEGPRFDTALIEALKHKNIKTIFRLDDDYPEAGECGLRSFCFMLGILEAHSTSLGRAWQAEILSYEGPFGVGYLVADFKLK